MVSIDEFFNNKKFCWYPTKGREGLLGLVHQPSALKIWERHVRMDREEPLRRQVVLNFYPRTTKRQIHRG
jgi:hypothetical protein